MPVLKSVFPNPIGSQAVFDLGKTDFKTGILQLYDLHGKLLRTNNFDQARFNFNRNDLAAGTYFYLLKLDGKDAVSGKLMIGE